MLFLVLVLLPRWVEVLLRTSHHDCLSAVRASTSTLTLFFSFSSSCSGFPFCAPCERYCSGSAYLYYNTVLYYSVCLCPLRNAQLIRTFAYSFVRTVVMQNLCGPDKHVIYSVGTELVDRVERVAGGWDWVRGRPSEFRSHGRPPTVILIK